MPNAEVVVKAEGKIIWLNKAKTGATALELALNKGGIRIAPNYNRVAILNDSGSFSHAKQTRPATTDVTLSSLYRDKAGNLLGTSTGGFEDKDANVSAAYGEMTHQSVSGGSTDLITVPSIVLMGYRINSAEDGNMIEYRFAGVGDPTFATVALSPGAITPGNVEAVVAAESYVRFKAPGATSAAKTLGFLKGGWSLDVDLRRAIILKTDGTFSHAKKLGDPVWTLSPNQLFQDPATNLLNDATHGYGVKATGKSVPVGTLAVESLWAGGPTLESIQLPNGYLNSWDFSQAEDGNPFGLRFSGVGAPTFAAATLA